MASPTGTGKTLTGFLVAIDAAYRAADAGTRQGGLPEVLYVSPLRALAVDVHENLHVPLTEIRDEAARLGYADPGLRVAVRTGDTPAAERAAMRKNAPDILVTTPESLYLLLTAPSSRAMLRGVRTVIVDEVHTLARDKRGSHLSLSLERLDGLVTESGGRLQRIGLSATQRPLDVVARLLSGVHDGRPPTVIVDCGHARDLNVAIELPDSELEAVASGLQFSDILDRIAAHTRRAPHDADLRQHPQDGRAGGPPAGRALGQCGERRRRRGCLAAGGRAPRQPLGGTPAHRRDPPAGRRPARPGGHGLVGTGYRRGAGRAGLPDRLAPRHRDLSPAGRAAPITSGTGCRRAGSIR